MTVRWVGQDNLGRHYVDEIKIACDKLGLPYIAKQAIPFSKDLPDISTDELTIFYGATNWINNIFESGKWTPGVFFNPDSTFKTWSIKYSGPHILNQFARVTTLKELLTEDRPTEELLFIRPDSDQKEFAGQIMKRSEIATWAQNVMTNAPDIFTLPIVVGEPYGIEKEWRLFIVDGKVSSGSQYKTRKGLDTSPDVPNEVIEFGEKMAAKYSPAPIFVMDIAKSNELYILEVGCFNSAGFYDADVEKIVYDVSAYVKAHYVIK